MILITKNILLVIHYTIYPKLNPKTKLNYKFFLIKKYDLWNRLKMVYIPMQHCI